MVERVAGSRYSRELAFFKQPAGHLQPGFNPIVTPDVLL